MKMKFVFLSLAFILLAQINLFAQTDDQYVTSIKRYQAERSKSFKTPEETPLPPKKRRKYTELPFYPINPNYRVQATFTPSAVQTQSDLPTFYGKQTIPFVRRGTLNFTLNGKEYVLDVYQRVPGQKGKTLFAESYYFVPFRDQTNGGETFDGGRYIDLSKSETEDVTLDFNLAYTPDCAYNKQFICPVPPKINTMETQVQAGEKTFAAGLVKKPKKRK